MSALSTVSKPQSLGGFNPPLTKSGSAFQPGKAFVVIGPSGVGKSTMLDKLRERGIRFENLISYTTRSRRPTEREGVDYFFVNKEEYEKRLNNNEFILSTNVHGNLYGVTKGSIIDIINKGQNLFCSLNTEAAKKAKAVFTDRMVTIFVAPSSHDVLVQRQLKRDAKEDELRLKNAKKELEQQNDFDYKIVNDDLTKAVDQLEVIFHQHVSLRLIKGQEVPAFFKNGSIRVMSYNIRMAPCAEDDQTENAWKYRLPKIRMIFDEYAPDVAGVQELSEMQTSSLQRFLNDQYNFIGKHPTREPRESGLGFIYNRDRISIVSNVFTKWLNESQERLDAPAWDGSSYERYVIYAKFKVRDTEKCFWFLTTHFDHLGVQARRESAKIVMDLAKTLDAPVILTGDFNCFPQLGGKELYELLCTHNVEMKDSQELSKATFGVPGSWIGWAYDPYKQKEGHAKYDHIFVNRNIQVLQHGIIDDRVWDERFQKELYPSDHRPVLSDVEV